MSKNLRNQVTLVVTSLVVNNVTINAPQNVSYTLTLPSNTGTNGQVLATNGSGVLSWVTRGTGGGSVTSVGATVPSFLSVSVANPTTTPVVNITAAATPTGTGSIVLSSTPTLTTPILGVASGTSLTVSNFIETNGSSATPLNVISSTSPCFMTIGQDKSNGNSGHLVYRHVGSNNAGNSLGLEFYANTGAQFRIFNSTSTPATFNCPLTVSGALQAPSLTLTTTPLPVTSGGTGTSSIGTAGQYAIVNAGATGYSFTTGPGGGGVSQVGLSGDTDFNSMFTISSSTSNPITASGVFTITMNSAPVITGNTSVVGTFGVSGVTTLSSQLNGTNAAFSGLALGTPLAITSGGTGTTGSTGGGLVVLQNTPTLTTPILNAATGTSLTLSGAVQASSLTLTTTPLAIASGGTGTTGFTGTGSNVFQTTPTLVTPVLGVATGTSLLASDFIEVAGTSATPLNLISSTTPCYFTIGQGKSNGNSGHLVYRHVGSNNAGNSLGLEFYANTGAQFRIFNSTSTPATLNCPLNITGALTSTGNSTAVRYLADITNFGSARKFVTYDVNGNEHQFNGIGASIPGQVYQVNSTIDNHIFRAGTSSTTSNELFKVLGTGGFTSNGGGTISSGGLSVTGDLTVTDKVNLPNLGFMQFTMSGNFGIPNNTDTTVGNFVFSNGVGNQLTLSTGDTFTNNLSRNITVMVSWSSNYAATTTPNCLCWVEKNGDATRYGATEAAGDQSNCCSAIFRMAAFDFFVLRANQISGFGQNISAAQNTLTMIIF